MTTNVEKIVEQVKALPEKELDEFLSWLAEYELQHEDEWDEQIAKDFRPGGRLEAVLDRARKDIVEGRVEPLDEIIDNS
ncbi:MAG: hypothetical protein HYY11_10040 [Candidatus Methylomirabilis oxyfera]|nr:hypothetical protein [Candidatus Methylomirabilis oxyfera]